MIVAKKEAKFKVQSLKLMAVSTEPCSSLLTLAAIPLASVLTTK